MSKSTTAPAARKPTTRGENKREQTYHRAEAARTQNEAWPADFVAGPTIGECLDAYHAEHAHRRKASRYYVTETLNQFMASNALDEGRPIVFLDKDHCKAYKAALLGGSYKRTRKPGPITINRKLSTLHHFVKWCVANDHMKHDIVSGLALPSRMVAAARVHKEAYSDEELSRIFACLRDPSFLTLTDESTKLELYWIVMMLAYTGCRAGEVLQLLRSDVQQEDGIWCIDVKWMGENKTEPQLKNRVSTRRVPIHSALLKLGFLDWYNSQNDKQLFPILFPSGVVKVTQAYSRLLKQLGIKRPALTLHSLRHTMAVKLERARVHYSIMRRLLGHTIGASVEDRIYLRSLKYPIKELSEELEKVSYPC